MTASTSRKYLITGSVGTILIHQHLIVQSRSMRVNKWMCIFTTMDIKVTTYQSYKILIDSVFLRDMNSQIK